MRYKTWIMSKIANAQAGGRKHFSIASPTAQGPKSITSNPFSNERSKQMTSLIQISTNASKLVHQNISEQRWAVQKLLYVTEFSSMLQRIIRKQLGPCPQNFRDRQLQFKLPALIRDEQWGNLSHPPPWSSHFCSTWVKFTCPSPHHKKLQ